MLRDVLNHRLVLYTKPFFFGGGANIASYTNSWPHCRTFIPMKFCSEKEELPSRTFCTLADSCNFKVAFCRGSVGEQAGWLFFAFYPVLILVRDGRKPTTLLHSCSIGCAYIWLATQIAVLHIHLKTWHPFLPTLLMKCSPLSLVQLPPLATHSGHNPTLTSIKR